jgi:hypothetical protein
MDIAFSKTDVLPLPGGPVIKKLFGMSPPFLIYLGGYLDDNLLPRNASKCAGLPSRRGSPSGASAKARVANVSQASFCL